jgi:uncharacterized protein (TIGR01627 family)
MPDANLVLPGALDGILSPPLVSLVLINWNYASFVGAAIESVKEQDYPWFEAIVVDNGSADESREVIAQHVTDDSRFRVIYLEKNLGQLGAFLDVFEELRGDFVTIVDTDDVLFSNFLSSHVQVHLALPFSVGLTSSNVVEMTATGRAITGGYASFNLKLQPDSRGLRGPNVTVRLSTISEIDYRQLSDATRTFVHADGWIWGPGTSNMFRRSVLKLVHYKPKDRTYLRAADNYLCPFCHVFGGSALIDKPLSAYRVHDNNYFAERESIRDVSTGRSKIAKRSEREALETLGVLFARAEFFQEVLPGKSFWKAADQLASVGSSRRKIAVCADEVSPFSDNYERLKRAFGEKVLLGRLTERLRLKALLTVLRAASDPGIPLRLRSRLLIEHAKSTLRAVVPPRFRPRRLIRHAKSTLRGSVPKWKSELMQPDQAPAVEEKSTAFGPAAILSFDPPILYSGIAFEEYIGIASTFGKQYGSLPAAFLIYPCWTIDSEFKAGRVIKAAREHQNEYPTHDLVFLCNTAGERDRLLSAGLNAHLLNKNFTVSEQIFRPLPDALVKFDAVYNARFDPRKHHELASCIPRVAYISFATGLTGTHDDQRALLADTLARHREHALLNPVKDGLPVRLPPDGVNKGLNRAAVGLCLSRVEGSNYASMEYMLAGLPVVSTPSIGGRDVYFDHEICTICDPHPDSVWEAVRNMRARNIPREYVRDRALAKIEPERRRFLSLVDDLSERLGGKRRYQDGGWPFGESSTLVTWKAYREHLEDFEKGRGAPPQRNDRHPSFADVEKLLDKTEGVQLQREEVLAIVRAIKSRPGCALLVFGCGNDSALWEDVNQGGTTAFIEDDPVWAESAKAKLKCARVYLTEYGTRLSEWISLMNATNRLDLDLPKDVMSRRWDVILVDGPPGHDNFEQFAGREAPGRMKSIFAASKLVAPGGAVFVHDCDRPVEQQYANKYLGSHRLFVSVKGRSLLQGYAF